MYVPRIHYQACDAAHRHPIIRRMVRCHHYAVRLPQCRKEVRHRVHRQVFVGKRRHMWVVVFNQRAFLAQQVDDVQCWRLSQVADVLFVGYA